MRRYVCIHGHFYQPPRENPWVDSIERQEEAHPYHDWNERINAECYAPNADARILDGEERIARIVNNYRSISFNFGPTLLSWLADHDGETYRAILCGDRDSRERFSGHGSALAQVYGHPILPLACARDQRTQVVWGLADFEHRFGRRAEGMWLPETAVDLASLELLSEEGIRFTLLAPSQAACTRAIGERDWRDASSGLDCGMPYLLRLPSGREICLFFFDAGLSHALAFGGLLSSGEELVRRLLASFPDRMSGPRLLHVATDGETYGHHHRFGDMALAYAIDRIERGQAARLTNYGEYLELHPPTHEVRIVENTAWSCAHGLGRWREDCGCRGSRHPDWKQSWRAPLREALDWLRDSLAAGFSREAATLFADPWRVREESIEIVLDRSREASGGFLRRHAVRHLDAELRTRALKLLELQRQTLLMYASCGWFFDDISGIESVQLLRHASRAIQLGAELFGANLERQFLERLQRAPSNVVEYGDGRGVYESRVRPAQAGLADIAANVAAGSLFDDSGDGARWGSFDVEPLDRVRRRAGRARLVTGSQRVTSRITGESGEFHFASVYVCDPTLRGAVWRSRASEESEEWRQDLDLAFSRGDLAGVRRVLEQGADGREPFERILDETLAAAIRRELVAVPFDPQHLGTLFAEARENGVTLERAGLGHAAETALAAIGGRLATAPGDVESLTRLARAVQWLLAQPLDLDLRRVENRFWRLAREVYPSFREAAKRDDATAIAWIRSFLELGRTLNVAGA